MTPLLLAAGLLAAPAPPTAPGVPTAPAAPIARSAPVAAPTSLWRDAGGDGRIHSLYSPPFKPLPPVKVNDIILIIVDERSMARNDSNTDLRRDVQVDTELKEWFRFDGLRKIVPAAAASPAVDFESERRQRSRGRTDRRDDMTFRIAAKVIDELPNGNVIISAEKHKTTNDEETVITLTGECRRQDIRADRSIRSEQVADLNIKYAGEGPVSRNQGRSIWTWLLDLIWF
ncbi:MAG: flagellar basal body L-ring protein FlgH [Planctomycetes bacterium]|nr:flagellar basal body L-ring protein FlgH [Planctomycetota bacterium]